MTEGNALRRRPVLQGILAAGAASIVPATAAVTSASSASANIALDLKDPAVQSHVFQKLGYSLDGQLGFWHLQATRYGLVGAELFPFWEMHIGSFFTVRDLPGGGYEVSRMGIIFYTDIDTGEYMRRFKNPFTGKTVDVQYGVPKVKKYAPPKPMRAAYDPIEGQEPPPEGALGLIRTGSLGSAWIQGDNIWIQQDHLLISPHLGEKPIRYNDLTTYFGPLSDVLDPSVKMARAGHAFSDINNWPAWLEMGDAPGEYYSRGIGYKSFSYDEMPETWRKLAEREYPDLVKDPMKALL
jgi:hypothetical protein